MNILLTTHNFFPYHLGGTEVYVNELALFLESQGHQVNIIAAVGEDEIRKTGVLFEDSNLLVGLYKYNNLNVFAIHYFNITTSQLYSRESIEHSESWRKFIPIRKEFENLDVLHVNGFTPTIGLNLILALKTKNPEIKIVTSMHTAIFCPKESLLFGNTFQEKPYHIDLIADVVSYKLNIPYKLSKLITPLLPNLKFSFLPSILRIKHLTKLNILSFQKLKSLTHEWWTYSNGISQHLINMEIPSGQICMFRHGIADVFFEPSDKQYQKSKTIYFFNGRLSRIKGIVYLLQAWSKLKENDNRELWIIGDGSTNDQEIKNEIEKLRERKDIKWIGYYDQKGMAQLLHQVTAVIIPSLSYEIGPLVFHEAIASKSFVLASNLGGCAELAEYFDNCSFTFEPGNSESLYQALLNFESKERVFPQKHAKVLSFKEHFEAILTQSQIYA